MAQPTDDRLRVGLIGYPLDHSLSPVFQQAAFDARGIAATYTLWPCPAETVASVVDGLRRPDALGCNVTVPHKERVVQFADATTEAVDRLGAANTLVRLPDGRLMADNTDVYGFRRSLDEAGVAVRGERVVVLGAGGAARAVLAVLADAGAACIIVANRNRARAEHLIASLGLDRLAEAVELTPDGVAPWVVGAGLVVNATSVGWHGDDTPLATELLPTGAVVFDLTYRDTTLLREARARGLTTLNGLAMLVYQGARSFELWTGREAPVDVMLAAAQAALTARQRT